jgi:uncharacterized DUF497 family protein
MIRFEWDEEKNTKLKKEREISFEEVVIAIKNDQVVKITRAKKSSNHDGQLRYLVNINQYIYVVPFVIDDKRNVQFLKTIYPHRKLTKKYLP